jgi:hypothetical protein
MKRLGRWLFNLAAGVSAMALVPVIGLYPRSFYRTESVGLQRLSGTVSVTEKMTFGIVQARGKMLVFLEREIQRQPRAAPTQTTNWSWRYEDLGPGIWFSPSTSGFIKHEGWKASATGALIEGSGLSFPHWALAVLVSVLPIVWLVRKRFIPHVTGLCPKCGYDLRARPIFARNVAPFLPTAVVPPRLMSLHRTNPP